MSAAPFAAYCPTCGGRRTFNLDDRLDVPRCVVCGGTDHRAPAATVRQSLVPMNAALDRLDAASALVHRAARDDRETIGELASGIARLDDELGELRDELLELSRNVTRVAAELARRDVAPSERRSA